MNIVHVMRLAVVGASAAAMIAAPTLVGAVAQPPVTENIGAGLSTFGEELGLSGRDLPLVIASIIRVVLSLLGLITIVIVLMGGFYWMTAGGNDERVKQGKKWIINGIIGLAIVLASFALSKFVVNALAGAVSEQR